jgi:hypothetical protein
MGMSDGVEDKFAGNQNQPVGQCDIEVLAAVSAATALRTRNRQPCSKDWTKTG